MNQLRFENQISLRNFALLILVLTLYYLGVVYAIGFFSDPASFLLRVASDSAEYVAVADWMLRGVPTQFIERRSFFYPLVLGVARMPIGNMGIWLLQMFFWVASASIFYLNLSVLIRSTKWRMFLLAVFCLSWTPILLTLLILTESLCLFLFSLVSLCLVYFFRKYPERVGFQLCASLICAGVLVAVKPNYGPLLYVTLGLTVLVCIMNRGLVAWRWLALTVAAALVPTFVQMYFNYRVSGEAQTSNIAHHVLQVSLYSQVLAKLDRQDFMKVREQVVAGNPDIETMLQFLARHPVVTIGAILHNFEESIRTVLHITEPAVSIEHWWRNKLNDIIYWLHVLFFPLTLWLMWRVRFLREPGDVMLMMLACFFVMGILPTGISFWAADRWTAPLLPLWPLLYLMVAQRLVAWLRI